jgi:predicted DNA-binding transcriptional regulator YafY
MRLLRMMRWLQGGRRLHVRETAKELGVDRRTVQRYLKALGELGVPLDYLDEPSKGRAYFMPFSSQRFTLDINLSQVVALNVALTWLEQFEGSVLFESLGLLQKEIVRWIGSRDVAEAEGMRWRAQKFFALPFLPYQYRLRGEAFDAVVTALLHQRKLGFDYRPATGGGNEEGAGKSRGSGGKAGAVAGVKPRRHLVRPFTLVFYKGAFYLAAVVDHAPEGARPSVFSLARMSGAQVMRDAPYDYPEEWDPSGLFNPKTGMMPGEMVTVTARFAPRFYDYLKRERRWPRGSKIVAEGDHVSFSAKLAANDELLNWFLGFGPEVEVVEPRWFRERLAEKARATARIYRGR